MSSRSSSYSLPKSDGIYQMIEHGISPSDMIRYRTMEKQQKLVRRGNLQQSSTVPQDQVIRKLFNPGRITPTETHGGFSSTSIVENAEITMHTRKLLGKKFTKTVVKIPKAIVKITSVLDGEHEARVFMHLASKKYSYVPRLLLAGRYMTTPYYILMMQYVPGKSLYSVKITPRLMSNLEKAVSRLWSVGIIHADLHPDNVIVGERDKVTIIDFGFAVILPKQLAKKMKEYARNVEHLDNALNRNKNIIKFVRYVQKFVFHRNKINPNTDLLRWASQAAEKKTTIQQLKNILRGHTYVKPTPVSPISSHLQMPPSPFA